MKISNPGGKMKDKRNRIKRAATILFAANGVKNTKMEDIANILGIVKGGIYYHYKNKEYLFQEIIQDSIESRQEFSKSVEMMEGNFEEKIKLFIRRRLVLKADRYNLFLFAKIYENGEVNLTYDEYIKRDQLFEQYLLKNKEQIKESYRENIPKLSRIVSSALTTLLLLLIQNTGVSIKDEESYYKMVKKFNEKDIEEEVELFYNLFFKEMVK